MYLKTLREVKLEATARIKADAQFVVLENYSISVTNIRAHIYASSLCVFVCAYVAWGQETQALVILCDVL